MAKITRNVLVITTIILFAVDVALAQTPQPIREWTVIHYVAGDNDADEQYAATLAPLKANLGSAPGLNWVMLVDLAKGYGRYDKVFGEDFSDTRIYELQPGQFVRRAGGDVMPQITTTSTYEANSGDAATLRDFIRYAKKYYPAKHYALVVLSHGWGVAFAPDMDEHNFGDAIYPAEMTDVLSKEDSVDLLVLDVCTFASVEDFYQWRPGNGRFEVRWVVASPPASGSPDYAELINRITGGTIKSHTPDKVVGGMKRSFKPADLTPKDFGEVVLSDFAENNAGECWGLYDLSHVADVKAAFDRLATLVAGDRQARAELEDIRGRGNKPKTMNYMDYFLFKEYLGDKWRADERQLANSWLSGPNFDAYDFGQRVSKSAKLSPQARQTGNGIAEAVDALVVRSFAGAKMWPVFDAGKHGVFFVFPDGASKLGDKTHWELMSWYSAADLRSELAAQHVTLRDSDKCKLLCLIQNLTPEEWRVQRNELESRLEQLDSTEFMTRGYGRLSWAIDRAAIDGSSVGNWYELLQSWYGWRSER
jgi:clostripain